MSLISLLQASTLLFSVASAYPSESIATSESKFLTQDQVANYTIVPWTWKGQVTEGGSEVQVEVDTLSDLNLKLKTLYPESTIEPSIVTRGAVGERAAQYPSVRVSLPIPGTDSIYHSNTNQFIECQKQGFDKVRSGFVKDGIDYLWIQKGLCRLGPGKGQCGRVSCSYGTAIYYCNDVS
jgi:hypothetical protein